MKQQTVWKQPVGAALRMGARSDALRVLAEVGRRHGKAKGGFGVTNKGLPRQRGPNAGELKSTLSGGMMHAEVL